MRTFITPKLVSFLYLLSAGLTVLAAAAFLYGLLLTRSYDALDDRFRIALAVGTVLATVILVVVYRVSAELVLVVFRIEEHLRVIRGSDSAAAVASGLGLEDRRLRQRIEPRF